ncbi:hypothetical protein PG994_002867 [Apiospora phragmitis]|uniref:Secreted protein n=1 Tax=Apiospora phragmitis TaxID=2905665 RepID=A0ABR1W6E0_9PEZI
MKMFIQLLAFLALLLCVAANDVDGFPSYGAPGDKQCTDLQMVDGPGVKASCPTYQPDKLYLCSIIMSSLRMRKATRAALRSWVTVVTTVVTTVKTSGAVMVPRGSWRKIEKENLQV